MKPLRKKERAPLPHLPGIVQVHLDISVNFDEMRDWTPQQLQAFLRGVGQVVAANDKRESRGNYE